MRLGDLKGARVKTWDELKEELRVDPDRESLYGRFLDKLALGTDLRGREPVGDLWYFSENTDFCLTAASRYLRAIESQSALWLEAKGKVESLKSSKFRMEDVRINFGCFSFYLYAALESFSHEINIFYGLDLDRKSVALARPSLISFATAEETVTSRITSMISSPMLPSCGSAITGTRSCMVTSFLWGPVMKGWSSAPVRRPSRSPSHGSRLIFRRFAVSHTARYGRLFAEAGDASRWTNCRLSRTRPRPTRLLQRTGKLRFPVAEQKIRSTLGKLEE
jgi:hypothetical protein